VIATHFKKVLAAFFQNAEAEHTILNTSIENTVSFLEIAKTPFRNTKSINLKISDYTLTPTRESTYDKINCTAFTKFKGSFCEHFKTYSLILNENVRWMHKINELNFQSLNVVDNIKNPVDTFGPGDFIHHDNLKWVEIISNASESSFPDTSALGFYQLANDMHNVIGLISNIENTVACSTKLLRHLIRNHNHMQGHILKLLDSDELINYNLEHYLLQAVGSCILFNNSRYFSIDLPIIESGKKSSVYEVKFDNSEHCYYNGPKHLAIFESEQPSQREVLELKIVNCIGQLCKAKPFLGNDPCTLATTRLSLQDIKMNCFTCSKQNDVGFSKSTSIIIFISISGLFLVVSVSFTFLYTQSVTSKKYHITNQSTVPSAAAVKSAHDFESICEELNEQPNDPRQERSRHLSTLKKSTKPKQ
jgi:hypothetical protein